MCTETLWRYKCALTLPTVWFHSIIHEKMLRKQWSRAWCIESESIARTPLIVLYECILANVSLNTTLSTASNYCHCHCSASSTAFCPLFSLVPKTFISTGTLTTIQHFWTWRRDSFTEKLNVQICGRPTPIWKSDHVNRKRMNSLHSQPQPPYAITLKAEW